ncbi:aspartate racemase [Novosphingobium fluoreni]|uniref:Aspartate racemase n=1 Tax=Novosphingobium fluoreni TaxID=1391222 RepID=A0A7W6FYT7_9SPHN|nr:amino acid racemase [uncultured Novosphingobium sp.]KTR82035.1 aspartate racemase [Novosphingobium barchaimii]MBB3940844.1 aspartate racemase [Novosphingobium fluoreni]
MRKIGLIGGLTWYSTKTYYEHIQRGVQARLGKQASASMVIDSLDSSNLMRLSSAEDWSRAAGELAESAKRLEAAGATAILIGANSMHKVYDDVAAAVSVPILHIAECVAERMVEKGVKRAALLGTRNVMLESFYRQKLIARDIELLPPDMARVETLDRIIYDELMLGKASRQAERELKSMITVLEQDGAEAVVLGCTELEMIVDVDANVLPIFDCTAIHAQRAVEWMLS